MLILDLSPDRKDMLFFHPLLLLLLSVFLVSLSFFSSPFTFFFFFFFLFFFFFFFLLFSFWFLFPLVFSAGTWFSFSSPPFTVIYIMISKWVKLRRNYFKLACPRWTPNLASWGLSQLNGLMMSLHLIFFHSLSTLDPCPSETPTPKKKK